MKKFLIVIIAIAGFYTPSLAQVKADNSKIDLLLIRGDYKKVIDTCEQILAADNLNSEIYYKMGLAYQNLLPDDKSFDCFLKASVISPDNNIYSFMLAKSFYGKGKMNQAKTLLLKLCAIDSMNWAYAYYLTSIFMQEGRYDESIKIYNRFYQQDTANYIILDLIGFACLRKGEFIDAIDLYNRSLALNGKNISAIKNLSFLYASTQRADTATELLTNGIKIDSTDMDLYVRRAALNYSRNYTKRALDDYLKVLSSGDSSVLYLKRAGIGYTNNLQPKEAIAYLLKAYKKDSSDYETSSYLGQNYYRLKDLKNSANCYRRVVRLLTPITERLSVTYVLLAEVLKNDSLYNEAITSYLKAQGIRSDVNIYMIIANLYDEKLNDIPKAIHYYQLFLDNLKTARMNFGSDYIEKIKKRLDFLKNKPKPANKKP
jgi:tetratricopeptide (TPR) repeat protein